MHAGKISGVAICGGNTISVGWDDTARVVPFGGAVVTAGVPLSGQPVGIAASPFGALAAVATLNGIQIFNGAEIVAELGGISYQPSSIAMLNQEEIAVGATDNKIYIYTLDGRTLALRREVTGHLGPVCMRSCHSPMYLMCRTYQCVSNGANGTCALGDCLGIFAERRTPSGGR